MALTVLNAIVVGLLAVSYVSGTDNDDDKETLRRELIDSACSFGENATAKQDFFRTVRTKHGVDELETNDERYSVALYRLPTFVRCFSPCPDATEQDITWCVNIFSEQGEIELCLNSTNFINSTFLAEAAGITDHFSMPQSCIEPGSGKTYRLGCLYVNNTQYYLNNAYLTCTSQSSTCYKKSFVQMEVGVHGYDSEPPTLVNPLPEIQTMTLGETSVLECSYILRGLYPFTTWRRNETTFRPISLNAPCNPAQQDCTNFVHEHPEYPMLLAQRVHMFQSIETVDDCPSLEVKISNYLVINNVTESDAVAYICEAVVLTLVPYEQWLAVHHELQTVTETLSATTPTLNQSSTATTPTLNQPSTATTPTLKQPSTATTPTLNQPSTATTPTLNQPSTATIPTLNQPSTASTPTPSPFLDTSDLTCYCSASGVAPDTECVQHFPNGTLKFLLKCTTVSSGICYVQRFLSEESGEIFKKWGCLDVRDLPVTLLTVWCNTTRETNAVQCCNDADQCNRDLHPLLLSETLSATTPTTPTPSPFLDTSEPAADSRVRMHAEEIAGTVVGVTVLLVMLANFW